MSYTRLALSPAPLDRESLSRLFYGSLAVSAWKQVQGAPAWSFRVNPSSGDPHPTEAYLVCGPVTGLFPEAGVLHYCAFSHALERRYVLTESEWQGLAAQQPPGAVLIALSSIYWREAWKYGERAFRYCHHDIGHAVAAIVFGAATLGWDGRLIEKVGDEDLESLLRSRFPEGARGRTRRLLMAILPPAADSDEVVLELQGDLLKRLRETQATGQPNILSAAHYPWPIIIQVATLTRHPRTDATKQRAR